MLDGKYGNVESSALIDAHGTRKSWFLILSVAICKNLTLCARYRDSEKTEAGSAIPTISDSLSENARFLFFSAFVRSVEPYHFFDGD